MLAAILNKKSNAGGIIIPQIILQSHSHRNSTVPAQKETFRPME
jgi:hypothetical protein